MVTKNKNFSGQATPSIVDTEYIGCNFTCAEPELESGDYVGVRLFPGDDTPRTFTDCNMQNREPPPGSTINKRCILKKIRVHVDSEYVTVDSVPVEVKLYAHVDYGYYWDGDYTYYPSPIETPCEGPRDT